MGPWTERPISVLVVEDDPETRAYLAATIGSLTLVQDRDTEVRTASDLAAATSTLAGQVVDLVMLDLDLPDSSGVDTVVEVSARTPAAIVVVTGSADPDQVERIVLAGAHGCLVKGEFERRELARTLRVTIARTRRVSEVVRDLVAQRDALAEALGAATEAETAASVESSAAMGVEESGLTHAVAGGIRLADSFPGEVAAAEKTYAELTLHRLEERGLHVDYRVATRARKLSWDLGRLRARPRDLVEIHLAAVRELTEGKGAPRRAALTRAAESLLVETMGQLATYYRTQQLGAVSAHPRPLEKGRSVTAP